MSIKRLLSTTIIIVIGTVTLTLSAQDFSELYRRANNGEVWAMNNLANCYANGEGVESNLEKAVYWYKKGAENGCETAMYNLSFYYKKGDVVEQNYEKALELLKRSARLNYSYASTTLGVAYFSGDYGLEVNYNIAKKYLKDASFTENVNAMCYYGWMHAKALGVNKDKYKAKYWLDKSVENGYAYANIPLYILSTEDSDFWGSPSYYKEEVLRTITYSSFCSIVARYYDKEYVRCINENDSNKDFYGQAAFNMLLDSYNKTGDAYACAGLGVYYEDGIGVEPNTEEALKYYIKSHELGMPNMTTHIQNACEKLNKLSLYFEVLSASRETTDTDLLNELAYCYAQGIGTNVNLNMAHTIIDRAIQIKPNYAFLYDSKGEFFILAGDRKNALKMYKKVMKLDPTFYISYPNTVLYDYVNKK